MEYVSGLVIGSIVMFVGIVTGFALAQMKIKDKI